MNLIRPPLAVLANLADRLRRTPPRYEMPTGLSLEGAFALLSPAAVVAPDLIANVR